MILHCAEPTIAFCSGRNDMAHRIALLSSLLLIILSGPVAGAASSLSADAERALKPGATFKECDQCPEMVVVPAGSFMMGSSESEAGRTITKVRSTK
jgi:formylglycine-generating enzyme required for sulfatase activity